MPRTSQRWKKRYIPISGRTLRRAIRAKIV
jgi:hypothetical protein